MSALACAKGPREQAAKTEMHGSHESKAGSISASRDAAGPRVQTAVFAKEMMLRPSTSSGWPRCTKSRDGCCVEPCGLEPRMKDAWSEGDRPWIGLRI